MMQLRIGVAAFILTIGIAGDAAGQGAMERAEADPSCAQIAAAGSVGSTLFNAFSSATTAIQSVWKLGDVIRGRAIEDALGGNDFNGKKIPVNMSQYVMLNGSKVSTVNSENFPTIDKWDGRTVTSIKSMDLNGRSFQDPARVRSKARDYVREVRNFKGAYSNQGGFYVPARGQKRALIIAVPACPKDAAIRELQKKALDEAIAYGKDKTQGIVVDVVVKYFI